MKNTSVRRRVMCCSTRCGHTWSSAPFHAGEKAGDPLVEANELMGIMPDARAWQQLMDADENTQFQERLREQTRTGRPSGEPHFIAHAEQTKSEK